MEYGRQEDMAPFEDDRLESLILLSRRIGADSSLTQPGGGNTSLKRWERDALGRPVHVLRVKGSGTDLATIDPTGFAGLDLQRLGFLRDRRELADDTMLSLLKATLVDANAPSPSVETPLHALLPYPCIAHTHDFATQALTDTSRPSAMVRAALGTTVAFLEYARPGYPLARALLELGDLGAAEGLVLEKHGLVAWGANPNECLESLLRLIERAEAYVRPSVVASRASGGTRYPALGGTATAAVAQRLLPVLRGRLSRTGRKILCFDDSDEARRFASSDCARRAAHRGMATPEHILRCGRVPLYIDADLTTLPIPDASRAIETAIDRFQEGYRQGFERSGIGGSMLEPSPRVLLLPGLGIVTASRDRKGAVLGAQCYRHVARVLEAAEAIDTFRFLDEARAFEFEYWPLELAKVKKGRGELEGRVALVTGAARGIGRAVAERFAKAGAHLVLVDLDVEGAREAADAICRSIEDPHRCVALRADATSESDVAESVRRATLAFGGIDLLVCNAGYVEIGRAEDLSPDSWDRHFAVNVRGYWLAIRAVIPIMRAQGFGEIVLNASKAAFAPAAENAAYASSKAAVAAMARSLALELGPDGIRVNYVNADFVDTRMMRGIIRDRAARKGLSEEEQTAEYRNRNILKVGPIPSAAVAEAMLFLASDRARYTTGSVITVDGGLRDAAPR